MADPSLEHACKWACLTFSVKQVKVWNKKMLDPLEAVKHSKREDGPYCTISGNEPSSVTLYKTGSERQTFLLQYQ